MNPCSLVCRRWSSRSGESFAGHAIAIVVGSALVTAGILLAMAVVFLPAGLALMLLGFLVLGNGVFAHITRPSRLSDLPDAIVGLAGAAIAMTFVLIAAGFVLAFGLGFVVSFLEWVRRLS